jgi:hypothetical protein
LGLCFGLWFLLAHATTPYAAGKGLLRGLAVLPKHEVDGVAA